MSQDSNIQLISEQVQEIEKERDLYYKQCQELKREINFYRVTIADLEKSLAIAETKHEKLKRNQVEQQLKIDELQARLEKYKMKETYRDSKMMDDYSSKYHSLLKEFDAVTEKCRELEAELISLRQSSKILPNKSYYLEYTKEKVEKEFLQQKLMEVQDAKSEIEHQLQIYKKKYEKLLVDVNNLRGKDQEMDHKIAHIKNSLTSSHETIRVLEGKVQKYKKKIKEYKNGYTESKRLKELTEQLSQRCAEIASLTQQVKD